MYIVSVRLRKDTYFSRYVFTFGAILCKFNQKDNVASVCRGGTF